MRVYDNESTPTEDQQPTQSEDYQDGIKFSLLETFYIIGSGHWVWLLLWCLEPGVVAPFLFLDSWGLYAKYIDKKKLVTVNIFSALSPGKF